MSKILKAEWTIVQATFEKAFNRLQTSINTTSPDISRIAQHRNYLETAIQEIEQYRPSQKNKLKVPLEYAAIILKLGLAKLLLIDADDILPPPNPIQEDELKYQPSNLPKLKLPTFDGTDPAQFPKFLNAVTVVLDKPGTPAEEKLIHLKNALGGLAKQLIKNLPVNQYTYNTALKKLKEKYDKPERIIASIFEQIRTLPPAVEDTKSLRSTLDKSRTTYNP